MGDKTLQNYTFFANNASFLHFFAKKFAHIKKKQYFCSRIRLKSFFAPSGGGQFPRLTGTLPGAIAQLVEQRTENPCVPSSILGGTTKNDLTRVVFWCPSTGIKLSKKKKIALSNDKDTQLVQPIDG